MEDSSARIEAAIAVLDAQRAILGDAVVDVALAPLRRELAARQAAQVQVQPAQQLKQVSVLFVDVVGSTAMGQQLGPEEISAVMDGALERFTSIVRDHHGRVLQYTGDGMLAAFGSEEANEDDVESAVRAGLGIIHEAQALSRHASRNHGISDFNVRAGVHTGTVLLGAGIDAEGSIRGATVNIAARMEQSAPPGKLRVSHDSYRHVRGLFEVTEQAPIQVKGIEQPLRSYVVERVKPASFRVPNRGIEGVDTQMVGRAVELGMLQARFATIVAEGHAQAVIVVGEAGLGKSRLLAEFQQTLNLQTSWVLLGRAHPRSALHPFGLLRDVLVRQFQIGDADPAEVARRKLQEGLAPLFDDPDDAAIALVGHLIGLDFSSSAAVIEVLGDERLFRERAFDAAAICLRKLAERRPAVLVLDDLHWSDSGTLDFVQHLRKRNADTPLLCVLLTRPTLFERHPQWAEDDAARCRLDIKPLDKALSQELAGRLLHRLDAVPAALRSLLTGGAEGNPFYMEELVKMLIDDGVIEAGFDGWRVLPDKFLEMHVPPTLTGVLQARIDALAPRERMALQHAAVVGHVFWERALAAIDSGAVDVLPLLLRKRLIVRRDTPAVDGSLEYAFQHNLLHQVTYDGVLKQPKRAAHAKVGAFWTERAEVSSPRDVNPVACRALAEAQYHRCKSDADAYVAWFEGQFSNYINAYAAQALRPLAEQMIGVCAQQFGRDHPATAKALTNLARVILVLGAVEKAEPLLQKAIGIQEKSLRGDHPDAALTLAVLGGYHSGRGDLAASEPFFQRALDIRERVLGPEHPLTLSSLDALAKVTLELGRLGQAEDLCRRVLATKDRVFGPDHADTAFARMALGEVLSKKGSFDEAERLIHGALTVQQSVLPADNPDIGLSMWHLAEALRGQGRFDEAEPLGRRSLEIWEGNFGPQHEWTAWGLISLAETRLAQGAANEAALLADRAVQVLQRLFGPVHPVLGATLELHGRSLLALGERQAAEQVMSRSAAILMGVPVQVDLASEAALVPAQGAHHQTGREPLESS